MKISNDTLAILKNFASINSNVLIKPGNMVKTISPVKNVLVDEGPYGKRHRPRARGRVNQIIKRTSHITIVVSDGQEENK